MEDESLSAVPIFKKRVKTTFKRKHDSSEDEGDAELQLSLADIMRQRKQGKTRKGVAEAPQPQERVAAPAVTSKQESDVDRMNNRFVPQTGQVVDIYDKQMNDYVEAKMAEYRRENDGALAPDIDHQAEDDVAVSTTVSATPHKPDKQSVVAGKLMEVDLGDSLSRHQEEAAARAERPVKVRLGRDGKPWRPRKRRNSESLARDALVDSILKESSIARFQDFTHAAGMGNAAQDGYVDEETVLQNFKSNYQDPERRDSRRPASTTKKQEPSRGPRLGGSKNARRNYEEKAAAAKKKT